MKKTDDTLISIIVPVYNMELYIDRCLESLVIQDHYDLQIIVVDDGSSDRSGFICDSYAEKDSRIEVYHVKNGGSVRARKIGLKHVKGKYVGFTDADDYVDDNMFSTMLAVMKQYDVDMVHTGYKEVNEDGVLQRINFTEGLHSLYTSSEKKEFFKKYIIDIKEGKTISYSIWSKLFKADLIIKCFSELDDEQQVGEDAVCLCRCLMESKSIYLLPKAMYNYRIRGKSLSHDSYENMLSNQVLFLSSLIKVLKEYGYYNSFPSGLYNFLKSSLLPFMKYDDIGNVMFSQYALHDLSEFSEKQIVIYGAGVVGHDFYTQIKNERNIDVVCFSDKYKNGTFIDGIPVLSPQELVNMDYDVVLIAVLSETVSKTIEAELIGAGVDHHKIRWAQPVKLF